MGVFDFFRRKPVVVKEPTIEQNVLVEETNEEKPINISELSQETKNLYDDNTDDENFFDDFFSDE